ncbi:MAG: AGE family epimerase/isomerase [Bacteroidota bacterium]
MSRLPLISFIFLLMMTGACQQTVDESPSFSFTPKELQEELSVGILHKWFPAVVDSADGGYLTNFSTDWTIEQEQSKMIVTQARHLWTSSQAALHFPKEGRYKYSADHGFPFLWKHMWDSINGGFYQYVDKQGNFSSGSNFENTKRAYGNAFGIYGLAAYYKLSGNKEALDLAKEAFYWLEDHSYDATYGGYFEVLSQTGAPIRPKDAEEYLSTHIGLKDYNSSIHLLEAFAELYRQVQDTLLEKRLRHMTALVRDTFTHERGYLKLYFTPEWQHISYRDSSESVREKNYGTDHVSPGHDIETAFLLLDAEAALGNPSYSQTLAVAKRLVDHTLATGFDWQKGGVYEQLYYVPGDTLPTLIDDRKNWWAQAESFHTLILFASLFPQEEKYIQAANLQWAYIEAHIIDPTHKGWYSYGVDTDPSQVQKRKGNAWKSAYHNGRALMESLALLETFEKAE